MRFVDDEEAHLAREQALEEIAILESLRREIENLAFAVLDLSVRLARLSGRTDANASRPHPRPARRACPAGPSSAR